MLFFLGFLSAFFISVLATRFIKSFSLRKGILDVPRPEIPRKIHKATTPLLGGLAVILSFDVITAIFYFSHPLLNTNIPLSSMLAIWVGSIFLAIGRFFYWVGVKKEINR